MFIICLAPIYGQLEYKQSNRNFVESEGTCILLCFSFLLDIYLADESDHWWQKSLNLKFSDHNCIVQGFMLQDSIINAAQGILKKQFPFKGGFQSTLNGQRRRKLFDTLPFDSHSIQILHTGIVSIIHLCTIFTLSFFILGNYHWICVEVTQKQVKVMDSLGESLDLNDHTLIQIASLVRSEMTSITIQKVSTQQQLGVRDCGLFAIAYSLEMCLGSRILHQRFDQNRMRHHLIECLENHHFTPFPKTTADVSFSHKKTIKVDVYCICRLPDVYDQEMIQCDSCCEWYHKKCIEFHDIGDEWACLNCDPKV